MLFWLKKIIAYWMMPMSLAVVALIVGVLLLRSNKRARLGRGLIIAAILGLVVLSNKWVSWWLMRPLETQYAPVPEFVMGTPVPPELAGCRYVVVLGGGNGHTPGMAALDRLSTSALGRLTEAVRILRVLPDAKMIVSGPSDGVAETHAVVLAQAAMSLGIARERIVYIDHAHDTEDESRATKKLVENERTAVVTSAWHMPRSMALFRSAGVNAVACPTDFSTHAEDGFYFEDVLWNPGFLARSSGAIRERIGYVWIWLRGKAG